MSDLLFVTMAGLPGAGKSSIAELLAREFGVCLLELDRIEAPLLERGISGDTLGWGGYKILSSLAEDHLSLGHSVILDCVCWTRDLRVQWVELAHTYRASFRPIEVVCSDEALHRSRLSQRRREARGLRNIDWQRVEQARAMYESWDIPRLQLDSASPLQDLLAQAVTYVRG
ncbi:MAG TPA: ATP-binding protein [Chloroflexota bacterium]|nr:ATP-binding protein [Chloroflexota bacterium]